MLADAIGYVDLRQICRCFARAVLKHIDFSRGYDFLEELRSIEGDRELQFSYHMQGPLRIAARDARGKKEEEEKAKAKQKENFEKIRESIKQEQKFTSVEYKGQEEDI